MGKPHEETAQRNWNANAYQSLEKRRNKSDGHSYIAGVDWNNLSGKSFGKCIKTLKKFTPESMGLGVTLAGLNFGHTLMVLSTLSTLPFVLPFSHLWNGNDNLPFIALLWGISAVTLQLMLGTWQTLMKCSYCSNPKELLRNKVKHLCTKIFIVALFKIKETWKKKP